MTEFMVDFFMLILNSHFDILLFLLLVQSEDAAQPNTDEVAEKAVADKASNFLGKGFSSWMTESYPFIRSVFRFD